MRFFQLSTTLLISAFLAGATIATTEGSDAENQGLKIEKTNDVENCKRPTEAGDTVSVHYHGTLESDGSTFDNSYTRGQPISFQLGAGRVIKGWDEGLLNMCIGEKRKLTIPPSLGYGDREDGPIPPGSTLVFDTELVSISGVDKDEL